MDNTDRLINLRNTLTAQLVQVKQRMQEKRAKLDAAIQFEQKQCDFFKSLCENTVVYTAAPPVDLIGFKKNLDIKMQELQIEYHTKLTKYNAKVAEFQLHESKRQSDQKARIADLRNELHCLQEGWYNEKKRITAMYEQELNGLHQKIRQLKAESIQLKCQEHQLLNGRERLANKQYGGIRDKRQELLELDEELRNANRVALNIQPEEVFQNEFEFGSEVVNTTAIDSNNEVELPDRESTSNQITMSLNSALPQTSRDSVQFVSNEPAPFLPLRKRCLDGDWDADDYRKHLQSVLYRIRDPKPLSTAPSTSKNNEGLATLMNIRSESCARQIGVKEPQERVIGKPKKRKILNESILEHLVPDASQK